MTKIFMGLDIVLKSKKNSMCCFGNYFMLVSEATTLLLLDNGIKWNGKARLKPYPLASLTYLQRI